MKEGHEREYLEFVSEPGSGDRFRKVPLHLLLYGRRFHRTDSYSVVDASKTVEQSHIYLTDAGKMFANILSRART